MAEKWYEGLPEDAFKKETDKAYEEAAAEIRKGLDKGLDFDAACAAIHVEDEELRTHIIDDMLKVLVAEEHFTKDIPLDELGKRLNVSLERLESAKAGMLEEVKNTSIKAFYKSLGHGNA